MATYAIGDIQGCFQALERLLEEIAFDAARDRLWLAGDLVNRGPGSLSVLRWARALGDRVVAVLGNHDLHLLAIAYGGARRRKRDTLEPVLEAPDREELLDWLRRQRLMHHESDWAMVHAGLLPQWSIAKARALASEVEEVLRGPEHEELFRKMYGNEPALWSDALEGVDRHRAIINALTRLRMVGPSGEMVFTYDAAPKDAPPGLTPWFDVPGRASAGTTVVCGHWAALGLTVRQDLVALDSGCVWGRALTAMRLEDRRIFAVSCEDEPRAC